MWRLKGKKADIVGKIMTFINVHNSVNKIEPTKIKLFYSCINLQPFIRSPNDFVELKPSNSMCTPPTCVTTISFQVLKISILE